MTKIESPLLKPSKQTLHALPTSAKHRATHSHRGATCSRIEALLLALGAPTGVHEKLVAGRVWVGAWAAASGFVGPITVGAVVANLFGWMWGGRGVLGLASCRSMHSVRIGWLVA